MPHFTCMAKHDTGHRMRSMVNFDMIDNTKNEFLKGDKSRIIIVLDKNHKFLGKNFHGGQVEHFGKHA